MTNNTIIYKDKTVYLDSEPRIGVCARCRYVLGEVHPVTGKVYKKTHRHHEQYDDNNALAHTIELCRYCHGKAHLEEEGYVRPKRNRVLMKVSKEAHDALDAVGLRGESFSDIILRLVKFYKDRQG